MRIENGQTYWEQVVKVWPVLEKWADSWVVDLTSNEVDDPEQGIGDIVIEELEGEPNSNYVEFVGLWYRGSIESMRNGNKDPTSYQVTFYPVQSNL